MYDGQLGPNEAMFDEPDPTFSNRYGLRGPAHDYGTDPTYQGSNDPRFQDPLAAEQPAGSRWDGAPHPYVPGKYPHSLTKDASAYPGQYGDPKLNANPGLLDTAGTVLNSYSYTGGIWINESDDSKANFYQINASTGAPEVLGADITAVNGQVDPESARAVWKALVDGGLAEQAISAWFWCSKR